MPLAVDAYSEPLILLHTSSGFKLCDGLVFNSTILKVFLFNCTSMLSLKNHHYLKMKVLTPFCFFISPISISNKYFIHVYVKWYFFVSQYIMDFFYLYSLSLSSCLGIADFSTRRKQLKIIRMSPSSFQHDDLWSKL